MTNPNENKRIYSSISKNDTISETTTIAKPNYMALNFFLNRPRTTNEDEFYYEDNNYAKNVKYIFNDFESDESEHYEEDEEHQRTGYCYLCSVKAHVHKKSEPVPMHKVKYIFFL